MPDSLIRVLELIQPFHSLMRAADLSFLKEVSAGCAWNAWEVLLSGCVGWEV
jgi:hypothetical protein